MTAMFTRRGATISAEEIASNIREVETDAEPRTPITMDRFDREMIELLLSWAPYGDPPEDECVPLFGIGVDGVKSRINTLIRASADLCIKAHDRTLLARAARLLGTAAPLPRLQLVAGGGQAIGNPPAQRPSLPRANVV